MRKRIALVTGASRGIGRAVAQRLGDTGIEVLAPARKDLDLRDNDSITSFLSSLRHPVDILINNAGINLLSSIIDLPDDNIDETLQVNLVAPLKLVRGLAPGMQERGYGRIVNISSIWGAITKPRRATYSMSKSGLNGLTRTLAVELAPCGILVNAVAPGYVNTELTRKNNTEKDIESIRQNIPIKRLAEPEEIAEVVAFLASERNSYVTGQVIVVDGGFTCQ